MAAVSPGIPSGMSDGIGALPRRDRAATCGDQQRQHQPLLTSAKRQLLVPSESPNGTEHLEAHLPTVSLLDHHIRLPFPGYVLVRR